MVTEEDVGQEVAEPDEPDVLDAGAAGAWFFSVIIAMMSRFVFSFGDYCNVVPFLFLSVIIAMLSPRVQAGSR